MPLWLVFVLIIFHAAGASAEAPARTALHWTRGRGAEQCIDGRALALRVEALLGPLFVAPAEAERGLEGSIVRTKHGFAARIVGVSQGGAQSGERRLSTRAHDCHALDAALVFVTALTVDPDLARTASPELLAMFAREDAPEGALLAELEATPPAPVIMPAPEPAPPSPAPPPPTPPPATPPPAPAPARARVRVQLALGAAWLGRTLPGWSPGPEARALVDFPRSWPLALTLRAFPRATEVVREAGAARVRAYALALTTCPLTLGWRSARVTGCVGAEVAHLRGRGVGFARDREGALWEPSVVAETRLDLALFAGFGLYGAGAVGIRLLRRGFAAQVDDGHAELLTLARVGVTLSAGASYAF